MDFQEFEKEVRDIGVNFGSELPKRKTVTESIQKSFELGLYATDAYWRALEDVTGSRK